MAFQLRFWGLNSGSHAFEAGAFPVEPSSQPSGGYLHVSSQAVANSGALRPETGCGGEAET